MEVSNESQTWLISVQQPRLEDLPDSLGTSVSLGNLAGTVDIETKAGKVAFTLSNMRLAHIFSHSDLWVTS